MTTNMNLNTNPLPERLFFYGCCTLFVISVVIFFSSCSVSRKGQRDVVKSHTEETLDQKTTTNTIAATNTRITEDLDTAVHFPGSKVDGWKPIVNLQHGDTLKTENNDVSALVFLDKNGNVGVVAKSKEKTVPVKGKKITEQAKTEATATNNQSTGTKVTDALEKHTESVTKAKNNLPWLLMLIIPMAILIYTFRKKIPIIKNL